MGAEQSSLAGYSTVDETDKLDALIQKMDQAVQEETTLRSSTSWKLPRGWSHAQLQQQHPKGVLGGGDRTPPLADVSFTAGPEQQDAIQAAVAQRLEAPAAQQRMERAVLERDSAAVRHLLQAEGASLEEHTLEGLLPIHVAAAAGHADMLSILGVMGASCDAGTRDGGDTALHLAAAGGGLNAPGRQECLEVLLGPLGAQPDLVNKDGRTPLHAAAQSGNLPALAALLAAGAHRSAHDKEGQRPVDLAGAAHAFEAVAYLDGLDARAQGDKLRKYRKWAA